MVLPTASEERTCAAVTIVSVESSIAITVPRPCTGLSRSVNCVSPIGEETPDGAGNGGDVGVVGESAAPADTPASPRNIPITRKQRVRSAIMVASQMIQGKGHLIRQRYQPDSPLLTLRRRSSTRGPHPIDRQGALDEAEKTTLPEARMGSASWDSNQGNGSIVPAGPVDRLLQQELFLIDKNR
jgi:hypothetical protein